MVKYEIFSLDNPPIVQTSEQAVPIPRIFGRARVAGQVIWADEFKIVDPTKKDAAAGFGFSLSFAIALCEGEIDHIGKIWVNNQLHDMTGVNWRYYKGSATQAPDPLLENAFGIDKAPAFKDVAYVVFEDLHLEPFGNLVPKFSFEVINAIGDMETQIKAVSIIPGATEFGYHTLSILREDDEFEYLPENQHGFTGQTDFVASIDELCNLCPNLEQISLIIPWFGDDLRASEITIRPCVDNASKSTEPETWRVSSINRAQAKIVSQVDGHAAFGGTPTDASVLAAISEFKSRGIKVTFYPFILMDIPAGNNLPNPYGGAEQAIYPWRGRITCSPAIGQLGSPDQTSSATAQIGHFFGDCALADIVSDANGLYYTGSGDWGYRRMILHYAKLCELAGGVEAFLLGSELVSLTTVRDSRTHFPAIDQLISLAADVRQLLPASKISYGADWTEYFGYHPADNTGDVFFHLDDFWADANVDFIGIDAYWPLSDWRDDVDHIDKNTEVKTIYDRGYLSANITSGEGFDYYYASVADRDAQIRTAINDSAYNKHWVFRTKDIKSWWQNPHYERINGAELASPTNWLPQSKPFWLTEIGSPAIDKGSNQPNVFYDPNSSEGAVPYYAKTQRDDLIQRRYIEAYLSHYVDDDANNPTSVVYGQKMLDMSNAFIWAYDARPYPAFPLLLDVWADGKNWNYGHWLNGRLGAVPLDKLILELTHGINVDVSAINGQVEGFLVEKTSSRQAVLQNILENFNLVAIIRDDVLIFKHLEQNSLAEISETQLLAPNNPTISKPNKLALATDMHLRYISDDGNYSTRVTSELLDLQQGDFRNDAKYQLSAVLSNDLASRLVASRLVVENVDSQQISLQVGNEISGLECGDVFNLEAQFENDPLNGRWRIIAIDTNNEGHLIKASGADASFDAELTLEIAAKTGSFKVLPAQGRALIIAMDLPILPQNIEGNGHLLQLAAYVKPWLSKQKIFEDIGGSFIERLEIENAANLGLTLWDFYKGPVDRLDLGNKLKVKLYSGLLSSISDAELLAGKNLAAIQNEFAQWEILQFKNAVLTGENEYEISHFIRGRFGTEYAMQNPVLAQAKCIILDDKITALNLSIDELFGTLAVKYGPNNKLIEDSSYQTANWQNMGAALRPFAPVHLTIRKINDDIELGWVRQTRFGGESWALNQVALNEELEQYEIEIWSVNGSEMLRQVNSSQTNITYSSAQQTVDFGGLAASFKVKLYQMSAIYGRGTVKEVDFYV